MMFQNAGCGKMNKRSTRASNPNNFKIMADSKRSQFKIQQMAFMLLAVTLFFILIALFWFAIQSRNLEKQYTQTEQDKAVIMAGFLSGLSEFSCSREEGSYCISTDKLVVLENKTVYEDFFPVSFIRIRRISDEQGEKVCNKVNYPNCDVFEVYGESEGRGEGSFVALCRYEQIEGYAQRICELGRITVGY